MNYTIYMHKNKINGKVYIGQSIQTNIKDRWKNGKGYKTSSYFYHAIEKYGWDNFEHLILEIGEAEIEEINEREKYFIKLFEAQDPAKGYNLSEGGKSVSKGMTEAAVAWMKEHPEFGLARAQDMLKWQAEHPEEAARYRKQNQKKMTEARKRKVQCIETGLIFESASEAARQVPKTTQSKICMVCRGQRKTCGGLHWQYYEEEEREKNE